jgi:hypothetical protein
MTRTLKTQKTPKAKGQRRHTNRACASCRHWTHVSTGCGMCKANVWVLSGDFWQVGAWDECPKWAAETRRTPVALAPRLPPQQEVAP